MTKQAVVKDRGAMFARRHFEVLADAFAGTFQFHVDPFQKPEQYTTRRGTWRATVNTVEDMMKVHNPKFDRDYFREAIAKKLHGHTVHELFEE